MQERTYITSLVDKAGHPSKKQSSIMGWFSLFALAVLGFFFVLLLTPHGAGATPDSVLYLDGARNLLRGFGYVSSLPHDQVHPIRNWPPLFSSTLALIGLSGVDPRIAARWLNSFLMGFNILLTGHLVKRYANGSWLASALAATLLLISYNFLTVHSMILSEPLFVALTLVGFVFLLKHLERPRSTSNYLCTVHFASIYDKGLWHSSRCGRSSKPPAPQARQYGVKSARRYLLCRDYRHPGIGLLCPEQDHCRFGW